MKSVKETLAEQAVKHNGSSSETTQQVDGEKPQWDADTGRLMFRGRLVRTYSGQAKNARAVLSAFQEQDWRARIDDPLSGGKNPERLNETVKTLNQNLNAMRFRADGSGSGYLWERATDG